MKNIFKFLLAAAALFSVGLSYATQAPGQLQAVSVGDASVQIDWEDVTDVLGYYLYYGESSGSGSEYDIEGIDLIEESMYELTGLDPDTTYYMAITAVDETGSESEKSPELEIRTLSQGQQPQSTTLRLVQVEAIDDTSIELEFSSLMETGTNVSRQFILENLNTGSEISIDISDVVPGEPRKVLALLSEPMLADTEYKITVLDIRDLQGNTIESGIDAFTNFTTPETFDLSLESAGPQESTDQEEQNEEIIEEDPAQDPVTPVDETSDASETSNSSQTPTGNNAGTTLSNEQLSENTLNAAAENDSLPQTGPEHWILLLVAVMLGTGIFYKIRN